MATICLRRWLLVGLAGAVLGAGPAAVDATLARLKAGSAEDSVVAALREARSLALARGQPVRVLVDEDLRSIWVEGGRWHKLPDGVSLAGPKADRNGQGAIIFSPDGSASGGQVVVSWRGRAVSVLVDGSSGRVRRVRANDAIAPPAFGRPGSAG